MDAPVPALADRAAACAEHLLGADRVLLASHIDADGLTSAAVAASALERAGIPHEVVFEKQLDDAAIARMAATDYETVLFTDFGSGQLETIAAHEAAGAFTPVVVDHHQPADADTTYHLNPLCFGIDGASELSGAGTAYVLARAMAGASGNDGLAADGGAILEDGDRSVDGRDGERSGDGQDLTEPAAPDNRDLAALAIVGAVGDMQATGDGLSGANELILEEGMEAGVVEPVEDLSLFGKQTRPLPKLLEYGTDVYVPGISNDEGGALRFLDSLDLECHADGEWRRWVDLTREEQRTVLSALIRRAVERGVPASQVDDLVGTTYLLSREPEGTELRDATEFSTLLNATARYDRADVGLAVCLGNREGALDRARQLLADHRRNLSRGIDLVASEGVEYEEHVQWFDAGGEIRETIVGIVAGMAFGSDGIDRDRPIVAFADSDEPDARKVSARGTHRLVADGLDLSVAIGEAARAVGGDGGGHDVAAGATVPAGEERAFIERVDELVGEQRS